MALHVTSHMMGKEQIWACLYSAIRTMVKSGTWHSSTKEKLKKHLNSTSTEHVS